MTAEPDGLTPVPDAAMATGSDDGNPGDPLGAGLLDDVRRGGGEPVVTLADGDSHAWADAVEDGCIVRGLD
jgi:hypothetical protein